MGYKIISRAAVGLALITLSVAIWQLFGAGEHYAPKPLGYPRIELPAHEYVPLQGNFPYQFELSKHAVVRPHQGKTTETYWIDICYPAFGAEIKLTYKPVQHSRQRLQEYCNDAYKLTAKHQVKASAIQEQVLVTPLGYEAVLMDLKGEVPSQVQFYTTDEECHFLRGALYFNTATENDYLAPVIAFIREDILHLLQTLKWKD
ncbi:MAG: gliding motility lipoprotein GldD [Phycisphaerae bacterium]|nr:gliding motility lipoprotein GldD [Phycisphaerae bacterium]